MGNTTVLVGGGVAAAVWLGFIMAASLTVTLRRVMTFRIIFGYATLIDVVFTSLLVWLFHGTLAGMSGAAVAGLVIAVGLSVGKWACGYRRLSFRGRRLHYVDYPGVVPLTWQSFWNWIRGKAKEQYAAAAMRAAT